MGWLKLIANVRNAEGVREAMRMAYDRHYRHARQRPSALGHITVREYALFGALESRLRLSTSSVIQPTHWRDLFISHDCDLSEQVRIWLELIPFLYLDEYTAREALAEYVVYHELPLDARRTWLTQVIRRGYRLTKKNADEGFEPLILAARSAHVGWTELIEDVVREVRTFDEKVDRFVKQVRRFSTDCKAMEAEDLEDCLARLDELILEAADEAERLDQSFKRCLVRKAYDKQQAGKPISRNECDLYSYSGEHVIQHMVGWSFDYPVPLTDELAKEWAAGKPKTIRNSFHHGN